MGAQEDREMLDTMAERLGLEDEDRDNFINSSMKRMGYKPRMDWDDPDPDEGNKDGGDFFSRRKEQRQSRDVSGGRNSGGQRNRASGGYDY